MAGPLALAATTTVAVLALAVSGASYRSMVRTGNPAIGFVAAAFLVLGAKNVAKLAFLLASGSVPLAWEGAFLAADLLMVGLVAWPLLRRRDR